MNVQKCSMPYFILTTIVPTTTSPHSSRFHLVNHYHHMVHMILSHLGTDKNLELKVRTFLRHIFLDHRFTDIRDYPFWLSVTLHMRNSAIERAHLLMLLYAPLKASTVTANGCIFVFYFSISNKTHSI